MMEQHEKDDEGAQIVETRIAGAGHDRPIGLAGVDASLDTREKQRKRRSRQHPHERQEYQRLGALFDAHPGRKRAVAHLLAAQQQEQAHDQDDRRPDPDRRRNAVPQSEGYREEQDAKAEIDPLCADHGPKLCMERGGRRGHEDCFRVPRAKTVASSFACSLMSRLGSRANKDGTASTAWIIVSAITRVLKRRNSPDR